jgi:SAM-dependent methyltransferase
MLEKWRQGCKAADRWQQGVAMVGTVEQGQGAGGWNSGEAYEGYVGRWSRLVAREFTGWLEPEPGKRWLDVGCGTGALSETALAMADPVAVVGVDPSSAFLTHGKGRIRDQRFTTMVGDARALPVPDGSFDYVISGLVLNFVPPDEQATAAMELVRAARAGATVAVYVWDYSGEMQCMRYFWDAAGALDPLARNRDEAARFSLCRPEALNDLFRGAGIGDIETRAIDVPTDCRDFDAYWTPFLSGQAPAPAYAMSLDEERRAALRERIRADLPIAADGSIHLTARAWAARGKVPVDRAI